MVNEILWIWQIFCLPSGRKGTNCTNLLNNSNRTSPEAYDSSIVPACTTFSFLSKLLVPVYSEFIKKKFPRFETLSSLKKFVNCVPLN